MVWSTTWVCRIETVVKYGLIVTSSMHIGVMQHLVDLDVFLFCWRYNNSSVWGAFLIWFNYIDTFNFLVDKTMQKIVTKLSVTEKELTKLRKRDEQIIIREGVSYVWKDCWKALWSDLILRTIKVSVKLPRQFTKNNYSGISLRRTHHKANTLYKADKDFVPNL